MAGAHDAVGDHALARAHVAGQAQLRTLHGVVGGVHTLGKAVRVRHLLSAWALSHCSAPPWQASQPTPSDS